MATYTPEQVTALRAELDDSIKAVQEEIARQTDSNGNVLIPSAPLLSLLGSVQWAMGVMADKIVVLEAEQNRV